MSRFEECDTIAARATAPGEGAIAIIRLTGPETFRIISSPLNINPDKIKHARLTHSFFHNPEDDSLVDEVLFAIFKSPHSYTGEDSAEIYCHGSPAVVLNILNIICSLGARIAEPGEFTKRAFLNGKMDLTKAEAVCDLIRSQTDKAAKLALRQLMGGLSSKIKTIKQILVYFSAEIEARIDFPEEELGEKNTEHLYKNISDAIAKIHTIISQGKSTRIYQNGARVVLLGKPNTGKSSLFNALLKMDRAIVTAHPGTTRDTIEGTVDLKGCPVSYIDTAGLRKSSDEIEKLGIERTKSELTQADLNLFLLDLSSTLTEEDREIFKHLSNSPYILVLNKSDLPEKIIKKEIQAIIEKSIKCVKTSSMTDQGIQELERSIGEYLLSDAITEEDAVITNERHLALLKKAAESMESARTGLKTGIHEELIMVDIRESLWKLGDILGEEFCEEILDVIFSSFCIGK
jgi:tRNA modification GTPase